MEWDDSVRLAAMRALSKAVAQDAGPLSLDPAQLDRIIAMLRERKGAGDIAIDLNVPVDTIMPVLWRIGQGD